MYQVILRAGASLAVLASLSAAPVAAAAAPLPATPPGRVGGDHLTVTLLGLSGKPDRVTYQVRCHPDGGDHPDVAGACRALERETRWGKDPFAPVADGTMCTMQYGGQGTAHVTGTWAGRSVKAVFDRTNGCEIARWDRLVPLLPEARG